MTGEDILKSGCRLLRLGVDEVLAVISQFARCDEQGDPQEWLSSVAVLASASQRSPRCARVSDSPQVGKKGAQ